MWQEPKTDWESNNILTKDDFNRIEENTKNLKDNKLDKVGGDGKDVIVTFIEAATDVDIASGDTHATLFGKILKNLNTLRESIYNIVNGGTTVGKAVTLNGLVPSIAELNFVDGVTSAIQTQLNGKAPTNHASTGTGYGVGTTANYGHCKTINDLTKASYANGEALAAYQGKVLDDKIANITRGTPIYITGIQTANQALTDITSFNIYKYRIGFCRRGTSGGHAIFLIDPVNKTICSLSQDGSWGEAYNFVLSSTYQTIRTSASTPSSDVQAKLVGDIVYIGMSATTGNLEYVLNII